MVNRVWLELERPSTQNNKPIPNQSQEERDALGNKRAKLASNMLRILGYMPTYKGEVVFWNERKQNYCFTMDEAGGFVESGDNGHWFNLDYFGKERPTAGPLSEVLGATENIGSTS